MKSILLGLCAAVCLALAANPAPAGWFSSDPRILCPYLRFGTAKGYYPYSNGGHLYGPRPWLWNR